MIKKIEVLANVFLLTLYVTGLSSNVSGQFGPQNKKRVENHKTFLKLPLEVFEAKIGDRPIALGEQFDGDVDWLKGLKVKIKNESDKTITWASISFLFPETRLSGPVMLDVRPNTRGVSDEIEYCSAV